MKKDIQIWKVTLLLLVGLLVFGYLLASTISDVHYVLTNPAIGVTYRQQSAKAHPVILAVVPGGPADRAGIREGDIILTVNGKEISETQKLSALLREVEFGESGTLTIRRGGETLRLTFTTKRRIFVYADVLVLQLLPGLLFCYLLCVIGIFVLLRQFHIRSTRLFYLTLITWATAMMYHIFSIKSIHSFFPGWLFYIVELTLPLAVSMLAHFYLIFPVEFPFFVRHRKWILLLIYAPVLLTMLFPISAINTLPWAETAIAYIWGFGNLMNFGIAYAALRRAIAKAPDANVRKQTMIVNFGTLVGLAFPTGYYYLPRVFFNYGLPLSQYVLALTIIWPVALSYAIVRHRFMNIDIIIKRGVAYALMSGFVVGAYLIVVVGIGQLFVFFTHTTSQIFTIIATLLIAALFNPAKNKVQNFLDRKFYPSRFVYRESVRQFSRELVKVVDLQKLIDHILHFLSQTMKIHPVFVLRKKPASNEFFISSASGRRPNPALTFAENDTIVEMLRQKGELLDLTPLMSNPEKIKPEEQEKWLQLQAEIVIPMLARGELEGMIALGVKGVDEPYYKEDIDLLQTLTDQINIAFENAILTEGLREQERMRKELEVARRIQLSTLPQRAPSFAGLDVRAISLPALEVGGDYYDYINFSDGRFGVVIGDVSGKGTSAALYMSQLKGVLQTATRHHRSLRDIAVEINSVTFATIELQSFITLAIGAFDLKKRKIQLIRAGHLPVIHYSPTQRSLRTLVPRGIGIGLEKGTVFRKELELFESKFAQSDVFLFFTDGIIEAANEKGEAFEIESLEKIVSQNGYRTSQSLVDKILSNVREFTPQREAHLFDDMTIVVVKVLE